MKTGVKPRPEPFRVINFFVPSEKTETFSYLTEYRSDGQLCSGGFGGLEKDLSPHYTWVSLLAIPLRADSNDISTTRHTPLHPTPPVWPHLVNPRPLPITAKPNQSSKQSTFFFFSYIYECAYIYSIFSLLTGCLPTIAVCKILNN